MGHTIIKIEQEWNGAHAHLDDVSYQLPGWAVLPKSFSDVWTKNKPFVKLTVNMLGEITDMVAGKEVEMDIPTPSIPPSNAELEEENKRLKEQMQALSDQNDFLESCIAEMAGVVYA